LRCGRVVGSDVMLMLVVSPGCGWRKWFDEPHDVVSALALAKVL